MAKVEQHLLAKRKRAERRFRFYGKLALSSALAILVMLIGILFWQGAGGFTRQEIKLTLDLDRQALSLQQGEGVDEVRVSSALRAVQYSLLKRFPEVQDNRKLRRRLYALVSPAAGIAVRNHLMDYPEQLGQTSTLWVPATALARYEEEAKAESKASVSEEQAFLQDAIADLYHEDEIRTVFNDMFFSRGDSRQPEQAGFLGAIIGSLLTVLVCLAVAFPIGVMTAVYLEEFAKGGLLSEIIEVNINNLAAVPSIVFGLLGLAVFLLFFGLPRSAPLVGGMTLAMMILPVIIIATRMALRAVPGTIRQAALALGASPVKVVWHHTLPLALPGIMTGTILGVSRALGETAPLLMIGMVAFVADIPLGVTDSATVMPVQIFLWASSPEAGFAEKTAAGILILLTVLLALNAIAIYIRKRFETRW